MELDIVGLAGACSYAQDCIEAELVHVTNKHSDRVACTSARIARALGIGRTDKGQLDVGLTEQVRTCFAPPADSRSEAP